MLGRFKVLQQIAKTGRLTLRLVRDPRVPMAAKLILGATAFYLVSPVDFVPDWFPLVGQADDLVAILAGLNLFIKACPRWLVEEHERGSAPQEPVGHPSEGRGDSRPESRFDRSDDPVIEGRYRVVR